jgi:hypothetical protein
MIARIALVRRMRLGWSDMDFGPSVGPVVVRTEHWVRLISPDELFGPVDQTTNDRHDDEEDSRDD